MRGSKERRGVAELSFDFLMLRSGLEIKPIESMVDFMSIMGL